MKRRNYGEITPFETRAEANKKIDRNLRYKQIIDILKNDRWTDGLTAKEISVIMFRKGYVGSSDRNHSAPRLTELSQKGIVEPIGKKYCEYTGKTVTVYALREGRNATERMD